MMLCDNDKNVCITFLSSYSLTLFDLKQTDCTSLTTRDLRKTDYKNGLVVLAGHLLSYY